MLFVDILLFQVEYDDILQVCFECDVCGVCVMIVVYFDLVCCIVLWFVEGG